FQPQYIKLIPVVLVVGFSILSWVLRKLQEQATKKKAREKIERRELELLRTGRPSVEAVPARQAPVLTPLPVPQSDAEQRLEELRRRREALAKRRAEEAARTAPVPARPSTTSREAGPPRSQPAPEPRPMIIISATSGPTVLPAPRPAQRLAPA